MHNTWLVLVLTRNITENTRDSHSHFYTSRAHVPAHHPDQHQTRDDLRTLGQRASWGWVQSPGPVWVDTDPRARARVGKGSLGSQPHSPNHQSGLVVSRKDAPSTTSDPAPVVYLEMRRSPSGHTCTQTLETHQKPNPILQRPFRFQGGSLQQDQV